MNEDDTCGHWLGMVLADLTVEPTIPVARVKLQVCAVAAGGLSQHDRCALSCGPAGWSRHHCCMLGGSCCCLFGVSAATSPKAVASGCSAWAAQAAGTSQRDNHSGQHQQVVDAGSGRRSARISSHAVTLSTGILELHDLPAYGTAAKLPTAQSCAALSRAHVAYSLALGT